MRLLDRYLLRELLVPLGYCLCGFLMLSIFSDLFASRLSEFQSKKMGLGEIVEYYAVLTPELLVTVLPIALLLALLYTLTNLARHHEITAMRAAGVSLWRLSLPYLGVGVLASLALFALNEFAVPDGTSAAEQIEARHLPHSPDAPGRNFKRDTGFVNHRDGRQWKFHVYNMETGEMSNLVVIRSLPDGSSRWLFAERAVPASGRWKFYNVREYNDDPGAGTLLAPLLQTNLMVFPFSETTDQINTALKLTSRDSILSARRADLSILEIRHYFRLNPDPPETERDKLLTKLQARLATPWTCLVVVLIAIPFGAASGRRNVFVGVASSILICFIYFILQQVGLIYGMSGRLPAWLAAWMPNLAFTSAALGLMARVR